MVLNRWVNIDESLRYLNFLEVTRKKDVLHQQFYGSYIRWREKIF